MEGKDAKSIIKRHKADKADKHGKYNMRASKQAKRETGKEINKRSCP